MAAPKNCTEHTIEINDLKKDMNTRIRHEENLSKAISNIEELVDRLNETTFKINLSLEHFKDIPDKVRKLEDRSIFMQVFEKFAWIAVGALTVALINQNLVATREKQDYQIHHEQPYTRK